MDKKSLMGDEGDDYDGGVVTSSQVVGVGVADEGGVADVVAGVAGVADVVAGDVVAEGGAEGGVMVAQMAHETPCIFLILDLGCSKSMRFVKKTATKMTGF